MEEYSVEPTGFSVSEAKRILEKLRPEQTVAQRVEVASELLLGRPYVEGSLGGGQEIREELRIFLDAFDCVTFMETVMAFAFAQSVERFVEAVRLIRYQDGVTDWFHRNHYMVDWTTNNQKAGFIDNITSGPETSTKTCQLNLIPGLPSKTARFAYFSNEAYAEVERRSKTADLALFVSTKENLDVFHTGVLIESDGALMMRHATRSRGAVIEQRLDEFASQNKMSGFVLLRPLCPS
jgi:hypothetical protein